jgi:YidC/Oxa1 family membrane protein insertase
MDKRTLLAVVLSVVIIVGGMILQQVFFSPPKITPTQSTQSTQVSPSTQQNPQAVGQRTGGQGEISAPSAPAGQAQSQTPTPGMAVAVPDTDLAQNVSLTLVRETDFFRLTFSRAGGVLTSLQLKNYRNVDGSLVDMVIPSDTGQFPFDISFGDYKNPWIDVPMALKEAVNAAGSTFEFSRTFLSATNIPFTLRKTYVFHKNEYLMELRVSIENSVNDIPNLGAGPYSYTLSFGPQIGPHFVKLDSRNEYRSFVFYADGKRKDQGSLSGNTKEFDQRVTWAGIVGKYFTVLAVPDATQYRIVYDARKLNPALDRSTMYLERPAIQAAKSQDAFRFYIGPKVRNILSVYNDEAKNSFQIGDLHLDEVVTSTFLIGWLAQLLNWILEFFNLLIPNYGVAIILLTLFTKVILLPLTFKSSEATARMQALNPKVAEIRERLKGKSDKMNQEIAELYKKEKVNPLSGCLPMLLQIPIFFALYSLLNDNFALRGALFIPHWMPDLSSPESVWDFSPFTLPILGWHNLRILPFLMLGTQFLTSKFTTSPDTSQQAGQMKLITYVLPAFFFFILYDMPSGLVLYWTVQNILSVFQQLYINHVNKKKKELASETGMVNIRRKRT